MMVMEKRVYQAWKGSNKFLFSGRLIFGPDVRSLVVSIFLIVVPVVIFCIFVARNLFHSFAVYNSGYAVLIVAVVLTIYVLTLLLLTSGRDPGIIPRNPHPPEPEECDESTGTSPAEWGGGRTPRYRLPRTKDVTVNGITVKVKYCDTCMLYRPPRCSHCSICNNCVERFDHHCPWVGQCIGQRNYRFFFMFVSSATLLCIYVFSFSAVYVNFLMKGDAQSPANRTALQAIGKSPASIVLMVYSFIAVWFVGGLTIFHLYLISTNQTTYENFRYRYDNRVNAFNRGVVKNFGEIFCSRIEPSKNDFRAKVQVDTSGRIITNPQPILGLGKQGGDLEVGDKLTWQGETTEVDDEVRGRISEGGDLALEMKQRYDDALARAVGHSLHVEGSEMGNQPRPSWSRKSGNWDTGSDALSVDPGRRNADKSPGRERVHWK